MIDFSSTPTGTPPTDPQKQQILNILGVLAKLAEKQDKLVVLDVDLVDLENNQVEATGPAIGITQDGYLVSKGAGTGVSGWLSYGAVPDNATFVVL